VKNGNSYIAGGESGKAACLKVRGLCFTFFIQLHRSEFDRTARAFIMQMNYYTLPHLSAVEMEFSLCLKYKIPQVLGSSNTHTHTERERAREKKKKQ